MTRAKLVTAICMTSIAIAACGGGDTAERAPDAAITATPDAPCHKPVVYINGLSSETTYTQGVDDSVANTTTLITGSVTYGPAVPDLTEDVLTATRAILEPLGVEVTAVDPGASPHLEIVLVGTGWSLNPSIRSAAPFNCRFIPSGIALIQMIPSFGAADFAQSVAFTVGVMNGLEQTPEPTNCMNINGSGACTFSDGIAVGQTRCSAPIQDQITTIETNLGCP